MYTEAVQIPAMATEVKIPDRAVFKSAEVCTIAELQPYVLRSWESEFPDLGVQRKGSRARVYRRGDLEQVLRIKALILDEGLTLGAARRKLLNERPDGETAVEQQEFDDLIGADTITRLEGVKTGLKELLALLDSGRKPETEVTEQPARRVRKRESKK